MSDVTPDVTPQMEVTAEQLSERHTIAELTRFFIGVDDAMEDLKKQRDKLAEQLEMYRGAIALKMDANQLTKCGTPFGTPYFSHFESMKVSERAVFFDWVFDHRASDVLTSKVSSNAVRDRAEQGENIPGLHIETIRQLRVLRK